MQKLSLYLGLLAALLLVTPAIASDLTGKWAGKTADGYDVILSLKSDGKQLTGALLNPDDNSEYPLQDVKLDGEDLAFSVEIKWQGSPLRILANGKTSSDQILLHLKTEDASWGSDATLTRQAEEKKN